MAKESHNITIQNIAKVAGVSISTVSRVVNGLERVAPDTRQRVESVVRKLKFYPNSRAQALSRKRTDTVGLIVPDFGGQYFSMLMEGAYEEASAHGIYVMVHKAKGAEEKIETVISLCSEGRTDGAILMLSEFSERVLEAIKDVNKPLVILDRDVNHWRLDNVLVDNRSGAFEAAWHFIDMHKITNLVFVGAAKSNVDSADRAMGFVDAMEKAALPIEGRQFFGENYSYEEGYRLTEKNIIPLITSSERCGIIAANDDIACGVIEALSDKGISVPEHVGVIGFDDSYVALLRRPKLTTVRIPTKEISSVAVRMIMDRLANKSSDPVKVTLKTRLIIRQSCGCK